MDDSTVKAPKRFTVTIIGGGIGGLALGLGLIRRNVPVQIYEAASTFREIGLGLSLGPAAYRALLLIDPLIRNSCASLFTTHAESPGVEALRETWLEIVWATGEKDGNVLMGIDAWTSGRTTLRRTDFLDALISLIPADVVHFGKRLISCREMGGNVTCDFDDGTSIVADVVIGCDGIKSRVKECMLSAEELKVTGPCYSGMYAYRGILDMEMVVEAVGERRARMASLYVAKGGYGITYPIVGTKSVNAGFYVKHDKWHGNAWIREASKEDMERDLSVMGEPMRRIFQNIPNASQWALFYLPHISTFSKSRVAIMGDAAHATTPHHGAGAGQAIEDAHVLAELLSDASVTTPEDAVAALYAYDAIRRPRSQRVVEMSKENGELLSLSFEGVGDDEEKLKAIWTEKFDWLWDINVGQQAEDARSVMLEQLDRRR